jgi:hypothetical protein
MALSETELALMDALKAIADVVIAANEGAAKALAISFEHQRDGKIQVGQPDAAALFELLRLFVADPERKAYREQVRRLLAERPQGRA